MELMDRITRLRSALKIEAPLAKGPVQRPLDMATGNYHTTRRGYIMRDSPKRDKSVSARQWKRAQKANRRSLKVSA